MLPELMSLVSKDLMGASLSWVACQCWKKQILNPECSKSAVEGYNAMAVVNFFPALFPQFERMKLLGYF
jgi:hypothetical protein